MVEGLLCCLWTRTARNRGGENESNRINVSRSWTTILVPKNSCVSCEGGFNLFHLQESENSESEFILNVEICETTIICIYNNNKVSVCCL